MANTIRIKRRGSAGATGAPESLENAELAFNEADNTLYYGKGTGGAGGTATSVEAIGGIGAFVTRSTSQTISGDKTFSGVVIVPTPSANTHATTKSYVDSAVAGVATNFTVSGDSGTSQTITSGSDTLTISGGVGLSSVSSNTDTITLNLDSTAVTAGTYGNSTAVGTFSVDAQGRLTAASNTLIAVSTAMIADRAVTAVKLANTAVVENNYGNASTVGTFYVDAQGRLGSASNTAIAITASQVTDFNEASQDAYGSLVSGGTQSGITVTYDDANTKVNFSVAAQSFTAAADGGSSQTITAGDTFTISGGTGLTSAATSDTITLNLDNTAVTAGNYGNASAVGGFTVDAQGRLTSASNTAIAITASQISDRATNLVTGLTGTANEITVSNSGVGAVTISLASNVTIPNNLVVSGDLTVQGNTTTLNTATLVVEDKNIVLSNVATPTDITADGAGITILGSTDKTLNWVDATDAWTSSEHFNLASAKAYYVNGTSVLSNTTLGSGVINSSLTSVGTISTGVWNGTTIGTTYGGTGINSYTTGDLVYSSSGNTLSKLAIGTAGQFLKVVSGVPSWSDTVDGGTF